jgi:hypothetical protein
MAQSPAPVPPPAEPPLVPTPRLRFARWLVQTGRLSEWDDAPHARGVDREHTSAQAPPKPGAPQEERGVAP